MSTAAPLLDIRGQPLLPEEQEAWEKLPSDSLGGIVDETLERATAEPQKKPREKPLETELQRMGSQLRGDCVAAKQGVGQCATGILCLLLAPTLSPKQYEKGVARLGLAALLGAVVSFMVLGLLGHLGSGFGPATRAAVANWWVLPLIFWHIPVLIAIWLSMAARTPARNSKATPHCASTNPKCDYCLDTECLRYPSKHATGRAKRPQGRP